MKRFVAGKPWIGCSSRLLILPLAVSLSIASASRAARTSVMYRMEPKAHEAVEGVTVDQIRVALTELSERKGWTVFPRTRGVLEADRSLSGGKHKATIVIVFDERNFVIRYVDSYNLGFTDESCRDPNPGKSPFGRKTASRRLRDRDGRCDTRIIHPTYNERVRDLEFHVVPAVRFLDPEPAGASDAAAWEMPAGEEGRKLEALHAAGVLTDEQLESHKGMIEGPGAVVSGDQ